MSGVAPSLDSSGLCSAMAERTADGLHRSLLAPAIEAAANVSRLRERALKVALRLERGMYWSVTARSILSCHYNVEVGAYSYGECFVPGIMPPGTRIGRYVSMAAGVRAFTRNHPMERLSLHPFFYNARLGFAGSDTIPNGQLVIEHDAWIGERAIITPGCRRIGCGAVVGAGAVVTKDVPDFAVVGGNPARLLRWRFESATIARIVDSRWWERSLSDLLPHLRDLLLPVEQMDTHHPLLRPLT